MLIACMTYKYIEYISIEYKNQIEISSATVSEDSES